jgi:hypothetical protein
MIRVNQLPDAEKVTEGAVLAWLLRCAKRILTKVSWIVFLASSLSASLQTSTF